ncbi:MAG TPA: peptide chain release factor N(5)-glutamine methyltransferase [Caulobacteraceae bacterium]|nr:peptide chain release factor N(5)-glutamine methyltransferase [Caulobacteraceae bacterium]
MSLTLVQAWTAARQRLMAAGVDSPVIDARMLVEAAAGATRTDIVTDPHRLLSAGQAEALETLVARRERREPISQILGRKGFWNIELKVSGEVLTPRPETELLVERALTLLTEDREAQILDLGAGSGAILLAILHERPFAQGLGVEVSPAALALAQANAAALGLASRSRFVPGDWTAGLAADAFDLVVSNPPYISSGDIAGLDPEVRDFEPRLALDGGPDGLDAYRALAPEILRVLKPGGRFLLEVGQGQARRVKQMMTRAGGTGIEAHRDLSGIERVVAGGKSS